jgi:hypothetical protein
MWRCSGPLWCRKNCRRDVLFVDALPRNEMRKVLKNVIPDMVSQ